MEALPLKALEKFYLYRHSMIKDLNQNHLNTEMTVDDVKKLLGSSEEMGYFVPRFSSKSSGEYAMFYYIYPGNCDCMFLIICFDNKGFYRSSYIVGSW
jgi:hypothetical protein